MTVHVQDGPRRVDVDVHQGLPDTFCPASAPPLCGDPSFGPIDAAASAKGLPVAIHPTGGSLAPPTTAGWPSTYLESHTMIATTYPNHVVRPIAGGSFEAIGGFRFVFVEGGVATFAPMLGRQEKNGKTVRAGAPWSTRRTVPAALRERLLWGNAPDTSPTLRPAAAAR